jgi:hypothetical protein
MQRTPDNGTWKFINEKVVKSESRENKMGAGSNKRKAERSKIANRKTAKPAKRAKRTDDKDGEKSEDSEVRRKLRKMEQWPSSQTNQETKPNKPNGPEDELGEER